MRDEVRLAAAFAVALLTTAAATPAAIALARRWNFFDHPASYKGHRDPTPYLGGAAVLAGFLVATLIFGNEAAGLVAITTGAVALWIIGTIDDRRTVRPSYRLVVTAAAAALAWQNDLGWSLAAEPIDLIVTVIWVIAVVNAFNLMDNMDGAAASVAAVAGAGVAAAALAMGDPASAVLALALAGSCVAFLPFNLAAPARIFLGDGGTMAIGFVVAATIPSAALGFDLGWSALVPAALLVGLPALDTALVIFSRYRRRVTIWSGGRDHVTYRLRTRLPSERWVALVLAAGQALLCVLAVLLLETGAHVAATVGLIGLAALAIAVLETPSWQPPWNTLFIPVVEDDMELAKQTPPDRRVRVLRIIARMNMGGPAHHVAILSGRLDPDRYDTLLVAGRVGSGEASLADAAVQHGARLQELHALGPKIRPLADLRSLVELVRIVRGFKPDIVHTHTAKAGLVGRLAALTARRPAPIVIHTFHGHVLEGYFDGVKERFYRLAENLLARRTDALVCVCEENRDDLLRLGVAGAARFRVVPLGLDLQPLLELDPTPDPEARKALDAAPGELVATFVGRLVRIKRVDLLLRAVALARAQGTGIRLAIVGDGPLRPQLENLAGELGIAESVVFTGYRRDLRPILAATDVAVLASDQEGTPVSLIEAAAAARPIVATAVGGVRSVVGDGSGILVPRGDEAAFAAALREIARDEQHRIEMGLIARASAYPRFSSDRLVGEIVELYEELLESRAARVERRPFAWLRPAGRPQRATR